MLDSGITLTLAQLVARLLPALADAAKAADAAALTTMVLEIVTALCNLDICLNPAVSLEQRAVEDCIEPAEVLTPAITCCRRTLRQPWGGIARSLGGRKQL